MPDLTNKQRVVKLVSVALERIKHECSEIQYFVKAGKLSTEQLCDQLASMAELAGQVEDQLKTMSGGTDAV